MDDLKPIKPCSYCGGELYLEVNDENGDIALCHATNTNCIIPDIESIDDMPIGSTLNDLVDRINVRPIETKLRLLLIAAGNALHSYEFGNASPYLAKEVAAKIDEIIKVVNNV